MTPKKSRIGRYKGLSGFTTPKMGFLLAISKRDPTCSHWTCRLQLLGLAVFSCVTLGGEALAQA